ncbi:TonB-dependent siderophore receptor [Myxococcus sp. RHSTA-1-4]|uniref:TonB-dependent receptor plug domain-containing protein n=1 Tax=Myxococcus sp. RHSTA-1-4 TaxID=2874601 RepID=UPI001CBC0C8D|nr:TonB-dependent receptor [Myxococcus sp. RHSTA-1-4]MBZ4417069.1 TonB-dependent receptor [Myxococcus sp. RHSTA-1-4]
MRPPRPAPPARTALLAAGVALLCGTPVGAQETAEVSVPPPAEDTSRGRPVAPEIQFSRETIVSASASADDAPEGRATSTVTRADLERRLPRSAPDALRWEPGVFVQQTAHAQGSAFVRGLTGQQTLALFDDIRLNTSTWRQGPNQYFFTLDSRTLDSVEVLRGGASTPYGSDALGGVLLAHPLEPPARPTPFRPTFFLRGATADSERGGRVQVRGATERLGFIGGVGGRRVGLLESGGPVYNLTDGQPPEVPRFDRDGRTQLGTGFDELTADGRLVWRASDRDTLTAAAYLYRQYDAPRTDQCAPPFSRFDECLQYDQQFRTLAYAAWTRAERWGTTARATLSWQQQHERRTFNRPAFNVVDRGTDDVDTLGATLHVSPSPYTLASRPVRFTFGADGAWDFVRSEARTAFTALGVELERSRGQYLRGSRYFTGGVFMDAEWEAHSRLTARAGTRVGLVSARAPEDAESGTLAVSNTWVPWVGHAGVEWKAARAVTLLAHLDRSFRAPNLDDLTSRQQTGPGFQFENAALTPERSTTLDLGARLRSWRVTLEGWGFATRLDGAIGRRPRDVADCPPSTPQCNASWSRFQLVNAREPSMLYGLEGSARLRLPAALTAQAGVAWTWGEGPNLADPPANPDVPYSPRVPLSRVPPLNGTVELLWAHPSGLSASTGLRWALAQERLAIADRSDARIPLGGTPGYAVLEVRAAWRLDTRWVVAAVLENVTDAAYRSHGSSVNGPGRGLVVSLEATPF